MPPKPKHRDVAEFLSKVRNFLLGREHKTALRFADTLSPRTQPPPDIPSGPFRLSFGNYYYTRDARSAVKPDIDVVQARKDMLAAKAKAKAAAKAKAEAPKAAPAQPGAKPPAPPKPSPPPKPPGAPKAADKQETDSGFKKPPTPGKMHSWDGSANYRNSC